MLAKIKGWVHQIGPWLAAIALTITTIYGWSQGQVTDQVALGLVLAPWMGMILRSHLLDSHAQIKTLLQAALNQLSQVPKQSWILLASLALVGVSAGCSFSFVKYDPQEVANVVGDMSTTFETYCAHTQPKNASETAQLEQLKLLQEQNYAKFYVIVGKTPVTGTATPTN